ncbi:MAG TPA: zinc finger-like domain-containing protein [Ktedonobacterales bacterium]|jgi:hypothetical protein
MGDNGQRFPPDEDELNRRIQETSRMLRDGLNEVGGRLRQAFGRLNELWEESAPFTPSRLTGSREEEYVRGLAKKWATQDFLVTPDLSENMAIRSWEHDDLWEVSVQTRWEARRFEVSTEPYTGTQPVNAGRILPVWDYELAPVQDLRSQVVRERVPEGDELALCLSCNGSGRAPCSNCSGRGWLVCSDCKGRTKLRCPRCKGKAIIPDWAQKRPSKGFVQDQAEKLASSMADRASDVMDTVRQYVPLPDQGPHSGALPKGMIPCPDCVEGEIDCTCGNGKRVCAVCQGSKNAACPVCKGSGKVIRHREIVRRFDVRPFTQAFGESPIPMRFLRGAEGEVIATIETQEALDKPAPPEGVPEQVWSMAQEAARANQQSIAPDERATRQVVELMRVPVVKVIYGYGDEPFVFYAFGSEGKEKFYAESFPPRWKRVERFVRSIAQEIIPPSSTGAQVSDLESYRQAREGSGRQRIPVEMPPVTVKEDQHPGEPDASTAAPESQPADQPEGKDKGPSPAPENDDTKPD